MSDDLLNSIGDNDNDDGDLLDTISDEDIEAWNPEGPDGIQGVVESLEEFADQYDDSDRPDTVPVVIIRVPNGELRRVIGYRPGLRKEIRRLNPQVGDLFAAKYLGTRKVQKGKWAGKDTHVYRAAVRRGTGAEPQPAATGSTREAPF